MLARTKCLVMVGSLDSTAVRHVLSVVGNRPQFIKSAPLSEALRNAGVEETVLHTGQHYDRELSEVFFDELGLDPPAINLDAGSGRTPSRPRGCCRGSSTRC